MARGSHGHYSTADELIGEAKKIENYLIGREAASTPEATAVVRTEDQSVSIGTASSQPFEIVGSYTSGDRNI